MPKPATLRQLGGLAEGGGYVYALMYSTGVVQVGRAQDARAMMAERRAAARQMGITVADWWVSLPMAQWVGRERDLAATCRDLGGREAGAGSFTGIDFAKLSAVATETIGGDFVVAPVAIRRHPDERMAVAARLRAEGLSLRKASERMLVSYGTVRRDLKRWDEVGHQMPPEIIRLSRPVTQPCYIGSRGSRSASGGAPAETADVTAARNTLNVIPLHRRSA